MATSLAFFVLAIVLAIAYLKFRMVKVPDRKDLQSSIDKEVAKFFKGQQVPGLVVGVYKGGKIWTNGYGNADKDSAQAPDENTIYQIGSLSKLLTAMLLQILCDEGRLTMEASLEELLGEKRKLAPDVGGITLRQLATHSSGLARLPKTFVDKIKVQAGDGDPMRDPYSYLKPEDVFDYLEKVDKLRRPGRFAYSNLGMGLLAHILEIVCEQSYESLVKEKILLPLGMNNTFINFNPETKAKLIQGYNSKGIPMPIWTFPALAGAGAWSSRAKDMIKLVKASTADSGLASELFEKMSKKQANGVTGIGWMLPNFIDRFVGNSTVVWHNGMVGGYASYLSIDKNTGAGVVILSNRAMVLDMLGIMLMRQIRTQTWSSRV